MDRHISCITLVRSHVTTSATQLLSLIGKARLLSWVMVISLASFTEEHPCAELGRVVLGVPTAAFPVIMYILIGIAVRLPLQINHDKLAILHPRLVNAALAL